MAKYHGGRVVPENPPRGESQSNGAVEETGKTVREYTRVLREQIEYQANIKMESAGNLTVWMIRWAAMICSRYVVGADGLTAYERRRGRKCRIPVVIFGERCTTRISGSRRSARTSSTPNGRKEFSLGIPAAPTSTSSGP